MGIDQTDASSGVANKVASTAWAAWQEVPVAVARPAAAHTPERRHRWSVPQPLASSAQRGGVGAEAGMKPPRQGPAQP